MIAEREWYREGVYVTHYPGSTDHYAILAPPIFEEMPRTSKVMVNLARRLASQGLHVVRFDYLGTGWSEASFAAFSLEEARRNLESVIEYARSSGAKRISLLGFRFGGYLAQEFSSRPEIAKTILWEPLTDLGKHFSDMLRITVANQMLAFGQVRQNSRQLKDLFERGETVFLDGYAASPKVFQEFLSAPKAFEGAGFDPSKVAVLLWQSKALAADLANRGMDVSWINTSELNWQNIRFVEPSPEALFEETESRLR